MTPSLQEYIQKHVVPARLKYKSSVRDVANEAIRIVMLDTDEQGAKAFFNVLIEEWATKKGGL